MPARRGLRCALRVRDSDASRARRCSSTAARISPSSGWSRASRSYRARPSRRVRRAWSAWPIASCARADRTRDSVRHAQALRRRAICRGDRRGICSRRDGSNSRLDGAVRRDIRPGTAAAAPSRRKRWAGFRRARVARVRGTPSEYWSLYEMISLDSALALGEVGDGGRTVQVARGLMALRAPGATTRGQSFGTRWLGDLEI